MKRTHEHRTLANMAAQIGNMALEIAALKATNEELREILQEKEVIEDGGTSKPESK